MKKTEAYKLAQQVVSLAQRFGDHYVVMVPWDTHDPHGPTTEIRINAPYVRARRQRALIVAQLAAHWSLDLTPDNAVMSWIAYHVDDWLDSVGGDVSTYNLFREMRERYLAQFLT